MSHEARLVSHVMLNRDKCFLFLSGGTLEMDDLKSYRVRVEDAWTISLGNTRVHIPPPPAGGALLAFMLKLIEGFIP